MEQLLPFLLLAAGAGAVLHGARLMARARASVDWPTVTGRITRSTVVRQRGSNHGNTFKALVQYVYRVNGRAYSSDCIAAGGLVDWSWRSPAESRCGRYPVGAEVDVHYEPSNPGIACLEHGDAGARFTIAVGALFAIVGVMVGTGLA